MTPARGTVWVRPVTTEESLPGGRIIIPVQAREAMTAYQMQVIAVGAPAYCTTKRCQRPHNRFVHSDFGSLDGKTPPRIFHEIREHRVDPRVVPEAWVIVQPRSLVDISTPGETRYCVRHDDLCGVFVPTVPDDALTAGADAPQAA